MDSYTPWDLNLPSGLTLTSEGGSYYRIPCRQWLAVIRLVDPDGGVGETLWTSTNDHKAAIALALSDDEVADFARDYPGWAVSVVIRENPEWLELHQ